MTAPFPSPALLSSPGGATVGDLRALDDVQALAVTMLRDWFDRPDGMLRVRDVFLHMLGPTDGQDATDAWSDFARFVVAEARRPVMRHGRACLCVGADEAVVAQVLQLAATGAREDAMLILTLLVPADRALSAALLAQDAGLAILRAARIAARRSEDRNVTLH